MKVNIIYYGYFREITGKCKEFGDFDVKNLKELFYQLNKKYNFELNIDEVLISVNGIYQNYGDYELNENDEVIILPPMSGG